jgi:hypothetical protein
MKFDLASGGFGSCDCFELANGCILSACPVFCWELAASAQIGSRLDGYKPVQRRKLVRWLFQAGLCT